jgi:protein-L-isoaspartate(D-aspartate) O-methyltransferase
MNTTTDTQPEDLRNTLVALIGREGYLPSASVERALRTVPRHRFVPDVSLDDAYANKSITTKSGPKNR